MSTSPSPATQATGKCVVCGKDTVTRCSACAKNGTDWMFFCSTEHQKLVSSFPLLESEPRVTTNNVGRQIWKVHKFVCGPRSKPFCWPGFSQQEIDKILAHLQKPTIKRSLDDIICAHGGFERFKVGHPQVSIRPSLFSRFPLFQARIIGLKDPGSQTDFVARGQECFSLRNLFFNLLEHDVKDLPTVERRGGLMRDHPFDATANILRNVPVPGLFSSTEYSSWSSEFQHRFLLCCLLANLFVTSGGVQTADYATQARLETVRFLRETVAATHPKESKALLEWLLPTTPI